MASTLRDIAVTAVWGGQRPGIPYYWGTCKQHWGYGRDRSTTAELGLWEAVLHPRRAKLGETGLHRPKPSLHIDVNTEIPVLRLYVCLPFPGITPLVLVLNWRKARCPADEFTATHFCTSIVPIHVRSRWSLFRRIG